LSSGGRSAARGEESGVQGVNAEVLDEIVSVLAVGLAPNHAAFAAERGGGADVKGERWSKREGPAPGFIGDEAVRTAAPNAARNEFAAAAKGAFVRGGHGNNIAQVGGMSND